MTRDICLIKVESTPLPPECSCCPGDHTSYPRALLSILLSSLSCASERALKTPPSPLSNPLPFLLVKPRGEIKPPHPQDSPGLHFERFPFHKSPFGTSCDSRSPKMVSTFLSTPPTFLALLPPTPRPVKHIGAFEAHTLGSLPAPLDAKGFLSPVLLNSGVFPP